MRVLAKQNNFNGIDSKIICLVAEISVESVVDIEAASYSGSLVIKAVRALGELLGARRILGRLWRRPKIPCVP
jgi:hypothetical protein